MCYVNIYSGSSPGRWKILLTYLLRSWGKEKLMLCLNAWRAFWLQLNNSSFFFSFVFLLLFFCWKKASILYHSLYFHIVHSQLHNLKPELKTKQNKTKLTYPPCLESFLAIVRFLPHPHTLYFFFWFTLGCYQLFGLCFVSITEKKISPIKCQDLKHWTYFLESSPEFGSDYCTKLTSSPGEGALAEIREFLDQWLPFLDFWSL
jgi:hypothetical protein